MTIYELTGMMLELLEMVERVPEEGEAEIDAQVITDTFEAVEMDFNDKCDAYRKVMIQMEADAAGLDKEIERLQKRSGVIKRNIERIKETLKSAMILTGKTKFKTDLFGYSIRENAASVDILNDAEIPERFIVETVTRRPDKKAIKDYLNAGNPCGWAKLKRTNSLILK